MKVAIIQTAVGSPPEIIHRGEWDGKRIDGEYARVTGRRDPVHVGYLFLEEHANLVVLELRNRYHIMKEAEDTYDKTWYSLRNQFGAR